MFTLNKLINPSEQQTNITVNSPIVAFCIDGLPSEREHHDIHVDNLLTQNGTFFHMVESPSLLTIPI